MLTISILAIILLLVIAVILIVSLMEKQPLDPNASGVILVDGQCAMCNGFAQFVVVRIISCNIYESMKHDNSVDFLICIFSIK